LELMCSIRLNTIVNNTALFHFVELPFYLPSQKCLGKEAE